MAWKMHQAPSASKNPTSSTSSPRGVTPMAIQIGGSSVPFLWRERMAFSHACATSTSVKPCFRACACIRIIAPPNVILSIPVSRLVWYTTNMEIRGQRTRRKPRVVLGISRCSWARGLFRNCQELGGGNNTVPRSGNNGMICYRRSLSRIKFIELAGIRDKYRLEYPLTWKCDLSNMRKSTEARAGTAFHGSVSRTACFSTIYQATWSR